VKQFGFPGINRVRSQQDFAEIYSARQRAGDQNILVFAVKNRLDQSRLGVSVSRKNGNAVKRARKKRLIREAFRLVQHQLPRGLDLIVVPRAEIEADLRQYQLSLKRLSQKLHRRLEHQQS
tara:strand:+ start:99184 stop:99546 length:363 start_codon:yes stop_codon:yes gene_type:complete